MKKRSLDASKQRREHKPKNYLGSQAEIRDKIAAAHKRLVGTEPYVDRRKNN
jgi:hypothetical protein